MQYFFKTLLSMVHFSRFTNIRRSKAHKARDAEDRKKKELWRATKQRENIEDDES